MVVESVLTVDTIIVCIIMLSKQLQVHEYLMDYMFRFGTVGFYFE